MKASYIRDSILFFASTVMEILRRARRRGFVILCSQNHDQVGNRKVGDRLTALATFEQLKLAAATVLLAIRAAAFHGRGIC